MHLENNTRFYKQVRYTKTIRFSKSERTYTVYISDVLYTEKVHFDTYVFVKTSLIETCIYSEM